MGQALGVPVWKLLGGARDRLPAYASTMCGDEIPGGLATPEDYAAFAVRLTEREPALAVTSNWPGRKPVHTRDRI